MKIILVRHGESEENAMLVKHKDSSLTKKGKAQAKHLGIMLKKIKISKIYTSNLKRAKETAEIISKIIHVPIKSSFEEFDEYNSKNLKSPIKTFFNPRLKKLKRIVKDISKEREREKTILIITHGITNRLIMGSLLQIPLRQLLRFKQHNTGFNVLYWNKHFKNWNLEAMNDISHLPKRLREENKLLMWYGQK